MIEEQDPAIGKPDLIDKLDPNVFRVIEIEAEVMCCLCPVTDSSPKTISPESHFL